jgi:hypothetical protein
MTSAKTGSFLSTLVFLILLTYGIVTAAQFGLCSQRNKDPECRTFESLGYGIDPRSISSHGGGFSSLGIIPTVPTTASTVDSISPGPLDQIPLDEL